ncbi:MAG TPA: S53 family peptidase [Candidatus Acidoferrales bacterium]|nr:S53 family peptidase [Candidatus Acidoferrales bacterium]
MVKQQNRVELKTSDRTEFPGARKVGPADPNERIEVTVVLRRGSEPSAFPSIDRLGATAPKEREHLSREDFAAKFGARAADIAKIRAFAAEYGLDVVSESPARRSVFLGGTVEAFSKAFGVQLSRYQHARGTYRCRTGTLQIPAELEGIIEGVFGLDNRPQAQTHFRRRKDQDSAGRVRTHAAAVSYTPLDVAQAYNFPAGTDGTGQCVAILELGGGYNSADLTKFFAGLKISQPKITDVPVDGGSNSPTGDPDGPDGEVELDVEVVGAIASGAKISVYFTTNTDQGFLDALTTAVHDTTNRPSIISISWGGPESSWTQQAMNSFSSACQDAATMGVTVLAASGDSGSTDGSTDNQPTVDFPASSPYILGCGGTRLSLSGAKITAEVAWNETSSGEGATGGGVSGFFAIPTYQQQASVPKSPTGFVGRGVPDVSGDADPETGYNVVVDGSATVIGGTSAVAPLWAGLLARINQSLGKSVGYVNPLLYASKTASTFHDIVSGTNGTYSAGPGWDACTGLGTPDGTALLKSLGASSTAGSD